MKRFLSATAFLTRIPIRSAFTAEDVGRGAVFFPVVGAGIGALQLGLWLIVSPWLSSWLSAVVVVSFAAWLTRGLHLDGLADFVDGLGGGRTPEDVLRIMKDSRIGAFGAIALFLLLAGKIGAVSASSRPDAFLAAGALSRGSVVVMGYALAYAGSSDSPSSHFSLHGTVVAAGLALAVAAVLDWFLMIAAVIVVTAVVGVIARRRVGGVTGDVMGANVELCETACLVLAL